MIEFVKMHGLGNDYVYIAKDLKNANELAVKLSNRHTGIGGDGIVLILPSRIADAQMRMYNADGSEGAMCGNAIRCVGKYLWDNKIVKKDTLTVETKSGIKHLNLVIKDKICVAAAVDMGRAEVLSSGFVTCVSVGNPHAVVFCENVEKIDVGAIGRFIERSPYFPNGTNVEFVQIIDRKKIKMRVWERGSGETMACGTGACASVAAAVAHGHCDKGLDIDVVLLGGVLKINYTDERVLMTGACDFVFRGAVDENQ
jgi:diaminopimelate epimerase